MQAIADLTGTLSVNFFHCSCDQIKQPTFETHVIFETEVVTFIDKDETISLNKGVNFEVSSVLNETMDVVEIVMDEFAKYCEYNSADNLQELIVSNNDKLEPLKKSMPKMVYYEQELIDLMNNLLDSAIVSKGTSETSLESSHTPVMLNSDSRRPDPTIENKEMSHSPPIVSAFDDVKGEGHFPDEEMLDATLPIHKKEIKNGPGSIQISNISDQSSFNMSSVSPSDEVICINNSVVVCEEASDAVPSRFLKDPSHDCSIESDCGFVLQNCVESICGIEPPWCGDSKLECSSRLQQYISIESKSDCNVVPLQSVGSECNVMTIQSVEAESNALSEKSVELENSVVPQKSPIESEISVVPKQSIESEGNAVIQKSIESDCSVILQLKSADSSDISNPRGEESDDSLSIISECSYASDDSCDSIPSFLSDSLVPDTPSESPIPIDEKPKEFLSPVSSSSIENKVGFSEPSSKPPEETCSNQPVAEESNSKIVNTEELTCNEMPITTLSTENELENCILNVGNDLNHTQTFDSCNKPDSVCLLEGEQKGSVCVSAVPNCLLLNECVCKRESDHTHTITTNGKSSPANCSSNDSLPHTPMLESHTDKLSSPDLLCEPQYQQTSRHFLKNVSSSVETLSMHRDASEERTKELLLEESPVSYASLISTCGLIFKDVNTSNTSSDEKKDTLPIESNVLSSVNTISWNPNYGCHFWLFTAGNSGVARLICVSELSPQENTLLLDKESICDNKK